MRTWRALVVLVATVLLAAGVSACSSGGAAKSAVLARASAGSAPGGSSRGSDACAEVRKGIDAFNQGDFQSTVDHFSQAVPLAKAQVAAHDTRSSEQLLEAVTYYAGLAPDQYLDAAQSSADFARYKAITLGQCEGADQTLPTPSPSGQSV